MNDIVVVSLSLFACIVLVICWDIIRTLEKDRNLWEEEARRLRKVAR